jgi:hypothetical protein
MPRRGLLAALLGAGALLPACSDSYVIGRFTDDTCDAYADAVFCSGFERPDLSDWTHVIVDGGNAHVEQTTERTHQGKGALHAGSTGAKSTAVVAKEFAKVLDGDLYLRAYLYVPGGLETKTMNIFFMGDFASPDPFKGVDFNLEDGAFSTYVPQDNPQRFTSATLTIPRDRWFCLQVHMVVSAKEGQVTIDADGQSALAEQGMNTRPDAGIHLLRIGIDWSSGQTTPFDYYVDDLVLSRSSIDCGS